jgi:hypothetical protein
MAFGQQEPVIALPAKAGSNVCAMAANAAQKFTSVKDTTI